MDNLVDFERERRARRPSPISELTLLQDEDEESLLAMTDSEMLREVRVILVGTHLLRSTPGNIGDPITPEVEELWRKETAEMVNVPEAVRQEAISRVRDLLARAAADPASVQPAPEGGEGTVYDY